MDCKACRNHRLSVLSGNSADEILLNHPEILPEGEIPKDKPGAYFIKGGIETVAKIISEYPGTDRIFPTAPVHVSAGIIAENAGFIPDPAGAEEIIKKLPKNLVTGRNGAEIYCSLNPDKACLKNCPEPPVCPVTKERRETPLWSMLDELLRESDQRAERPFIRVIQSRQYGPGLGYIAAADIKSAINSAESHNKLWIATACKCHGVVTALKRTPTE